MFDSQCQTLQQNRIAFGAQLLAVVLEIRNRPAWHAFYCGTVRG
jgi:hypothetical protein